MIKYRQLLKKIFDKTNYYLNSFAETMMLVEKQQNLVFVGFI